MMHPIMDNDSWVTGRPNVEDAFDPEPDHFAIFQEAADKEIRKMIDILTALGYTVKPPKKRKKK